MAVSGLRRLDMALGDTSLFIAQEQGRQLLAEPPQSIGVSVVTIGELRWGVLGATDPVVLAQRLDTLLRAQRFEPFPISEEIAEVWANLRTALRRAGRRLPLNDSWIAATAIGWRMPLVTQDDDYDGVPGLEVIRV